MSISPLISLLGSQNLKGFPSPQKTDFQPNVKKIQIQPLSCCSIFEYVYLKEVGRTNDFDLFKIKVFLKSIDRNVYLSLLSGLPTKVPEPITQ